MPIGTAVDHENLKKKQRRARLRTAGLAVALSAMVGSGVFAADQVKAAGRRAEAQRQLKEKRLNNYREEVGWRLAIPEFSTVWDIRQKADLCNEMQVKCYQEYLNDLKEYIEGTKEFGREWVVNTLEYESQCADDGMYNAKNEDDANKHLARQQRLGKVKETMEKIWKEDAQFREANHYQLPLKQEGYWNGLLTDIGNRQTEANNAQRAYQKQNRYNGR